MFWLSVVIAIAAIVALVVFGLNLGVDFRGGSVLEVSFAAERPAIDTVVTVLEGLEIEGLQELSVNSAGSDGFIIRSGLLSEAERVTIMSALQEQLADAQPAQERFESIGPAIGQELKTKSMRAIVILLIVVVAYIAMVFRGMSRVMSPWAMGLAALVALLHDIVIALGLFSVIGYLYGVQITAVFVAAALTILGYSLSDTVVVFDRVRENILRGSKGVFAEVVHKSVMQTLVRSLNTTLTTVAALVAILLFGGETLKYFALALIVGISLGSYSSIFVATPLLVWLSRQHTRR
jgi:preprotein translocase subunit SecF